MHAHSSMKINKGGFEENTLAILDSSGIGDCRDIRDDRLAFLEAVRFASLASESSTTPTWKMYDAVFNVFRDGTSLEEIMASYQLLVDLEKHYPRLSLVEKSKSETSCSESPELVVAKEGWLPFGGCGLSTNTNGVKISTSSKGLLDAHGFSILIHDLAQAAGAFDSEITIQLLKSMLLLQYLVYVLERDFLARETMYKETMSWLCLRESLLILILGSRKINVRHFVQDCMCIISRGFSNHKDGHFHDLQNVKSTEAVDSCGPTLLYAALELGKKTVVSVEKLFSLIIYYDTHRKVADTKGFTSRADAVRVPLIEMIVDQLSYNKEAISPFLLGFSITEWKLEIIVQYFWKYCGRSTVHTRRSNSSPDDATLGTILKYFSNVSSAKSLASKMSPEVAQTLLAHGFQAYVSVRCNMELTTAIKGIEKDDPLLQVSKGLICAFENIKEKNEIIGLSAFEKEAFFTAATILALDS